MEQEKQTAQSSKLSTDESITLTTTFSTNEYYSKKFSFNSNKILNKDICQFLQKDLQDYQIYTKSFTAQNQKIINDLLDQLKEAVNEITDKYEVKLYGSRATNLCLMWSDLDVVIIKKNPKNNALQNPLSILDKLCSNLNQKSWIKAIKYINTAKVPIIKLTTIDEFKNMQIDISMEDQSHYGLKCVDLVKGFIKEYEVLEPLVFAIKTLLKIAYLNDPYTGGISSYGVILMIVFFLKQEKKKGRQISLNFLGELFIDFLLYYGSNLNSNYINPGEINITFLHPILPSDLIIIDPLNENNNVGKSTFQYFNIRCMFLFALFGLQDECFCGCHYNSIKNGSPKQNEEVGVHNYLKKMFNAVKRFGDFSNKEKNYI